MKKIIGKIMYSIFRKFHASDSKFNFGGKIFRNFACKLFFEECGHHINIDRDATIGKHIKLGDYSGIGKNSYISDYVKIGKYVMMGPECFIYTRNHKFDSLDRPMCFQGFDTYKPVTIGDDVWIGGRVIILPGVNIGEGAIIGAGSVVTKNVEPYTVVAGNPAKVLKKRNEKISNVQ